MVQFANAMLPGPPLLLECPKCGHEKRMMSIMSGNTFGAVQWCDLYMDAPMLPRLSPVQKCPECNSYFLLSKAKDRYDESEDAPFSSDTGKLTYNEMKEAMSLLNNDSISKEDEITIRMELLHRYNDAFRLSLEEGDEDVIDALSLKRDEADKKLHQENIRALIPLLDKNINDNVLLTAELYREAGDFENCLETLDKYRPDSEYADSIARQIFMKARQEDDQVFQIME